MEDKHLSTNQGIPVTDNQNSLTVGRRGPVLLQDVQFIEKMAHFDREGHEALQQGEISSRS